MADRIFMSHAAVVRSTLFEGDFRHFGTFGRRHQLKIGSKSITGSFVQRHGQFIILTERKLGKTEFSVFGSPYHHVTLTGCQEHLSFRIRLLPSHGIELCIIVEFELHTSIRHRIALPIRYRNDGLGRRCIVTDYIDFRIIGSD